MEARLDKRHEKLKRELLEEMAKILRVGDQIFMDPVTLNDKGNPLTVRSIKGRTVDCALLRSTRTRVKMYNQRILRLQPVYYKSSAFFRITTIKSKSGKIKYRRHDFMRRHHALEWSKRIRKR